MSNVARNNDQVTEAKREFALAGNTIARIVTNIEDLNEEAKALRSQIAKKIERESQRLKEISQAKKLLTQQQSEAIGGYKLAKSLLKKWKVDEPTTKLTAIAQRSEVAQELVGAN